MSKCFLILIIVLTSSFSFAQSQLGIPLQLKLKSPSGTYPTEAGVNVKLYVLSPTSNCVLREETFSSQNVVNGQLNLVLGSGTVGGSDPGLSLNQVFNNSAVKSNLDCIDSSNSVISSNQTFTPLANSHRVVRLSTTVLSDSIIVNFDLRSQPYAIHSENASNSVNFSGNLVGDVTGTQSATSVDRIKGVPVSSSAPTAGQVLQYNGAQYVPVAIPSAPVTSVAGKTGVVTLVAGDISGLGTAASLNVGVGANQIPQLDGAGKLQSSTLPSSVLTSSSVHAGDVSGLYNSLVVNSVGGATSTQVAAAATDVAAATNANVANSLIRRDASGNFSAGNINGVNLSSTNVSTNNVYLYSGANSIRLMAPAGLSSNLTLSLPPNNGSAGQLLQTNGAGQLSWVAGNNGTVTAVTASAPLSSTGGSTPQISISQANSSTSGFLTATDWQTFNSKQNALGFTPLDSAAYATDLASASCTTSQTPYWNTITDSWQCQAISFPADAVSSVAGKTGVVSLVAADVSGLGSAATLNVGTAANEVVQLDAGARIPASTLPTNALTTSTIMAGDVSGNSSSLSVDKIKGQPISSTAPVAGQVMVYNGTQWVPTNGLPAITKKTANEVLSSNAQVNVGELSFAVSAGATYRYKFHIMYSSVATTTGIRLGLTYPTTTAASAMVELVSGADGTGAATHGIVNSSGDSVVSANTPVANTIHTAYVEGIIVPSAAGTVQLRGASEINASNVTIYAGSFVEVTTLP